MLELIKNYLDLQLRKSPRLSILNGVLALGILGFLLFVPHWLTGYPGARDIYVNLLASLLGFLFGAVILVLLNHKMKKSEDQQKVIYDDRVIRKQYGDNYLKTFSIHRDGKLNIRETVSFPYSPAGKTSRWDRFGHWLKRIISRSWYRAVNFWPTVRTRKDSARVYAECLLDARKDNWAVNDSPDELFQPRKFIRSLTLDIMAAHGGSMRGKADEKTFRLKDCRTENGKVVLDLCRSTYLAHLLTNRAIDFKIRGKVSLRELYEQGDELTPLAESEFANHIGVNALVFLENRKYILLPERDNTGTIAKEMLTASLATRLKSADMSAPMTREYIEKDAVMNYLAKDGLKVEQSWLDKHKDNITVEFLGASRDIYEGGKPTLFYVVDINKVTAQEYMEAHYKYSRLYPDKPDQLDRIKHIHVVLWNTLRMSSPNLGRSRDKLVYTALRHYKYWIKSVTLVKNCEKNLLAAFWFLRQSE